MLGKLVRKHVSLGLARCQTRAKEEEEEETWKWNWKNRAEQKIDTHTHTYNITQHNTSSREPTSGARLIYHMGGPDTESFETRKQRCPARGLKTETADRPSTSDSD